MTTAMVATGKRASGRAAVSTAIWCAVSVFSCATAPPATLQQLHYRAAFDLGCTPESLAVYNIDGRTKGVYGCGRRLAYVERCESVHGEPICTWMLDSPASSQPCVQYVYGAQFFADPGRADPGRLTAGRHYRPDLDSAAPDGQPVPAPSTSASASPGPAPTPTPAPTAPQAPVLRPAPTSDPRDFGF